VIPGHGRLCDRSDVTEYRDMVSIIRDRIQDLIRQGKTLDQVQASNPTQDYDPLFGATSGRDMFVASVYRSLTKH
jgi:cyclase